ncbi:MAG: rod shape-determining protein MreD [Steroidobacteraceae bacterium]
MITRESFGAIAITCVAGLVLSVVPLPHWLALLRPGFLLLVVLYWSTMAPFAGGILLGFLCGLALDVFQQSLLGQHALAVSMLAYLAIRFHLLMRAKPLFEQSLYALAALVAYEVVLWAIDGWTGHPRGGVARLLPAFTGALVWPMVVGVLGRFHTPR